MQNSILEVKNLTKNFGSFTAVDNISFSVADGEILGLLGPNGAGKTTAMHMLLGITLANGGTISYFGKDFLTNRQYCLQHINFASAFNTLQGRISVWENLLVFAHLYQVKNPKKKIMDLVEQFSIHSFLNNRYWDLSTGQKSIVNIIKSLLNDPQLLLMDEPTAGLDPDVADKTLSFIEHLRESRNIAILYTSHDMEEVTRLCDRVIFLDHGKIVAEDSPLNLTKQVGLATLALTFDGKKQTVESYLKKEKIPFTFVKNYLVHIQTEEKKIPSIIFDLGKHIWLTDIDVKKPTLEDVFLEIVRGKTHAV
ncbi:MAG: ABC transporter ATP-binding protein [Candidatus Levybacteria bacterium]|nr:ABC transporter ATP-binding protein [Candidatus Levybacteria bacterium]